MSRVFLTDPSGNYYAPDFKPGSYTLEVSKSGFRKGVLQDISLQARQELREDFVLQVGSVDQQVVVSDSAAGAINTENSSISASIDSQGESPTCPRTIEVTTAPVLSLSSRSSLVFSQIPETNRAEM
ncbi:MAG: hypothetical protein DMG40_02855 [Acidobacteria bacterium]|nr:MAG: hypothetical protein DMG40_02855 [Acidobacteriota bacterium]